MLFFFCLGFYGSSFSSFGSVGVLEELRLEGIALSQCHHVQLLHHNVDNNQLGLVEGRLEVECCGIGGVLRCGLGGPPQPQHGRDAIEEVAEGVIPLHAVSTAT